MKEKHAGPCLLCSSLCKPILSEKGHGWVIFSPVSIMDESAVISKPRHMFKLL